MKKLIVILLMIIISITSVNFCLANEKKDNNPVCIIKTSMGDIFVELFAKEALHDPRRMSFRKWDKWAWLYL